MKINKEFIMKNLMGIICAITIIAMFFPFISVDAKVSAGGFGTSSGATEIIGFAIVTEGGFLGILLDLSLILIIASCYVPQLKAYRKIITAAASVIGLICLFIVPSSISSSVAAAGGSVSGVSTKVEVKYLIGFWILLIGYIALIALSVIQFLNLKGNKIFDTINDGNDGENSLNIPPVNLNMDKIKGMAQNVAGNISNAADGIKNQVNAKIAQSNNTASETSNHSIPQANNGYQTQQQAAVQNQSAPIQKENPEDVMKQIKALHEMKEAGILTEEEFTEKKQEFLKKI